LETCCGYWYDQEWLVDTLSPQELPQENTAPFGFQGSAVHPRFVYVDSPVMLGCSSGFRALSRGNPISRALWPHHAPLAFPKHPRFRECRGERGFGDPTEALTQQNAQCRTTDLAACHSTPRPHCMASPTEPPRPGLNPLRGKEISSQGHG